MPFGREVGVVALGLDALLDPRLLVGIGDVHELDADGAAVCRAHMRQDLAQGRPVEARHVGDEDRAVVVRLGEAIGRGMQLRMRLYLHQPEGIEVGLQMAAHAIGADELQRANGIDGGAADLLETDGRALTGKRRRMAVGAVGVAVAEDAAALAGPARPGDLLLHRRRRVMQLGEEAPPALVHLGGRLQVAGIELGDERGIAAGEKGVGIDL